MADVVHNWEKEKRMNEKIHPKKQTKSLPHISLTHSHKYQKKPKISHKNPSQILPYSRVQGGGSFRQEEGKRSPQRRVVEPPPEPGSHWWRP